MKTLVNGIRRKKAGRPTPESAILTEDHPPPHFLVRDRLLCFLSHYYFGYLSLSDESNHN